MYFLLSDLNPGKETLGKPYESGAGIPDNIKLILLLAIVMYGLYVGFRVWLLLRKERKTTHRKQCVKRHRGRKENGSRLR